MGKWLRDKMLFGLVPVLARVMVDLLWFTMRVKIENEESILPFHAQRRGVVLGFWHDQMLLMIKVYRGPGIRALMSASRDGAIAAAIMRRFGCGAVCGSSSRHGAAALKEMVQLVESGVDIGITPDGPRGPRHEMKAGVAQVGKLSGCPVFLGSFACSRGHRFASWDRFVLPYPGAKCVFRYSGPHFAQPEEEVEAFRLRLQREMEVNQEETERCLEAWHVSAV